ncbi:hypothetical protein LTSEINV_0382, partial [Salmonella enterica subsp. enterica serovar Inverness str. R8-3668]
VWSPQNDDQQRKQKWKLQREQTEQKQPFSLKTPFMTVDNRTHP